MSTTDSRACDALAPEITSVPLLDVGRGNDPLKAEIMQSISEIIDTGRFIGGPFNQFLENAVADISGAKYAIGCASGSDALLLALMAFDIGPGDEVLCPSFTFFATASAVARLGAKPVFVDIDPVTFNIDPNCIEAKITSKTKAVIPVHLFGKCADMDAVMELAAKHNLKVIEDCAQSIGAGCHGRGAGSMGDIGCFSFYPTKNLGGFGDGGMLTTNSEALSDRLRLLANHGMKPRYYHQKIGINSRLDAIQAAALCAKFKHIESYSKLRQKNASRYQVMMAAEGLDECLVCPMSSCDTEHVWNQFTIRVPNGRRDQVRSILAEQGVGSEIYYPIPVHQQECFAYLECGDADLPETVKASKEVLSLPIFPELTPEEQAYVIQCLVVAMS